MATSESVHRPVLTEALLRECCASERWVALMTERLPLPSVEAVHERAAEAFDALGDDDWRQAFAAHARIGQLRAGDETGSAEQSGAASASAEQQAALAEANERYEARFGHVFLIRARGRDAAEMLAALRARLANPPEAELAIAAAQQREITRLRLDDVLSGRS
jgi:OHCU decarboxylase